jgi:hypothetical protein
MVPISSDAGEIVIVRSAFTDVIIPASGDYALIVAREIVARTKR